MKKTLLMLVGAIVFGVLAAFLSIVYIKAREAAHLASLRKDQEQMVEVVVATSDLPKGTEIAQGRFALRNIPAEFVHPEAITLAGFDALEGRILVEPLAEGKPLLRSFVEESIPIDFSDTLSFGRRAMTIQVDELDSIANMARPGNRVDVYVLAEIRFFDPAAAAAGAAAQDEAGAAAQPVGFNEQAAQAAIASAGGADVAAPRTDTQERPYVIPVLQAVEVLATDQTTDEEFLEMLRLGPVQQRRDRYTTMTVDVSPKEAALLALAQEKGELVSLLRNREDDGGALFAAVGEDDLFLNSFRMVSEAQTREGERSLDGLIVTEDGRIMTRDGRIIDDPNLIVKDGVIMTKDGTVLSGRGLIITEDGKIMTKDGKIIDPSKVRTTADGRLITEDGEVIGGTVAVTGDGRIIGADGEPIDPSELVVRDGVLMTKDGRIVSNDNLVVGADGRIMIRDGRVLGTATVETTAAGAPDAAGEREAPPADSGLRVTADGRVVDADGNEVDPGDLVVRDGVLMTRDGRVVSEGNFRVTDDGRVLAADGSVIADRGVTVTDDGRIIGPDGREIDPSELVVKDGVLMTRDGVVVSGTNFVVTEDGRIVTATGEEIGGIPVMTTTPQQRYEARTVDFIVGGTSKNGVTPVTPVEVVESRGEGTR